MIQGNTQGIRDVWLEELEKLYDAEFGREDFLPDRLLNLLVRLTSQTSREIMVYLSRDGAVIEIAIGSIESVGLPERHMRRSTERLSGIRCIHTHPGGSARLSDIDEQALRLLRFDAMCAVGVADGRATGISAAFLGDAEYGKLSIARFGPVKPGRIPQQLWMHEIELADRRVEQALKELDVVEQAEKALLISIDSEESLEELGALAATAGAVVTARALQNRQKPDSATYIGSGKAEELALDVQALEIDLVIVDDELTASQQRNLEAAMGARVIDRTALILDIFAARAQSREGKLQVELAQMKYRLPRLAGQGTVLSRLGGGIGTRGPGETQLEVDRRRARKRIDDLTQDLKELQKQRALRRTRRAKDEQVTVALVGYTNAGKSTLLNALSGSDVLVEDKLFATLDPVVRKIELPENRECLLVDTVGFIRKLPHALVEAFKSTLEEALEADLLVVVSDLSSPHYMEQRAVVYQVLSELGAAGKPTIEALNKADRIDAGGDIEPKGAIVVSGLTGQGLDRLRAEIADRIAKLRHRVEWVIPYDKGGALSLLHDKGQVLEQEYLEEGVRIACLVDQPLYQRVQKALR
ncbi:MAG: GTPase HflX [Christensenellaceae bacterium]|nr:GTPase HflX [Christensenellaceae bacterium]MEA5068129.1 GTPase HflX [Christensenellaceae bacterium]